MKALLTLAILLLMASPALAGDEVNEESKGVFTSILRIVLKWIFPIGAAYCFLHGIVSRGVKRGEWDMAAISTVAAIALALFPKLLSALFGVDLSEVI
ncbi:MAG: hypothetical protein ACYTAF_04180 [Planctomycetota bacterium]|jgi:hypothetical protein